MKCLGSTQHIKHRFGASYQIELRCNISEHNYLPNVIALLTKEIVSLTIEECHGGFVRFKADSNMDLSRVFSLIERHKDELYVMDYSVSQSTLEQIFIEFARDGNDNPEVTGQEGE